MNCNRFLSLLKKTIAFFIIGKDESLEHGWKKYFYTKKETEENIIKNVGNLFILTK